MAPPAWFYSTIAQAVAAIIGFAIAFTISTYVSRRERINRLTDEFQQSGREVRERYYFTLEQMADILRDVGDFTPPSDPIDIGKENNGAEQIEEWANRQTDTQTARAWGYLTGAMNALDEVVTPPDDETKHQFGGLNTAAEFLHRDIFGRGKYNTAEDIYREIENIPENEDVSGFYGDDIFQDQGKIGAWLQQNLTQQTMGMVAVGSPNVYSGQTMASWSLVIQEFRKDVRRLTDKSAGTRASEDITTPVIIDSVLGTCMRLGAFGVALPLAVLVFPDGPLLPVDVLSVYQFPEWANNVVTLVLQLAILLPSLFFSLQLFQIMYLDTRTTIPSTLSEVLSRGESEGTGKDTNSSENSDDSNGSDDSESAADEGTNEGNYVHPMENAPSGVKEAIERIGRDRPELAERMRHEAAEREQFDWVREQARNDIDTEED